MWQGSFEKDTDLPLFKTQLRRVKRSEGSRGREMILGASYGKKLGVYTAKKAAFHRRVAYNPLSAYNPKNLLNPLTS